MHKVNKIIFKFKFKIFKNDEIKNFLIQKFRTESKTKECANFKFEVKSCVK